MLRRDRSVMCWGDNATGQLGIGALGILTAPVAMADAVDVRDVGVGGGHICVRRDDGRVACVGRGFNGQTGTGMLTNTQRLNVPVVGP